MNKLAEIFQPQLHFIGSFNELPATANLGDICVVDNKEYVYGFDWQELATLAMSSTVTVSKITNQTLYI